jgi:hypothetical protein
MFDPNKTGGPQTDIFPSDPDCGNVDTNVESIRLFL